MNNRLRRRWRRFRLEWELEGVRQDLSAALNSAERDDPNPHRRASYERYIEMLERSHDDLVRRIVELR